MKELRKLEFEYATYTVAEIEVRDRARKDLGNIQELMYNIETTTLLHPITVTTSDVTAPYKVRLVAGGRRLTALSLMIKEKKLVDSVPCRILHNVDEHLYKLLELGENVYRKSLDFREEIALKAKVMKLGQELYGKATPGGKGFSMEKAADIVGVSQSSMSKDITLHTQLNAMNDMGIDTTQFKTKEDAAKFVKTIGKTAGNKIASAAIKKSMANMDAFKKNCIDTFIVGDALEGMSKLPDESYDFAEIDPPYGIDFTKNSKGFKGNYLAYTDVDSMAYADFMYNVLHETYRLLKPNSFAIVWHSPIWEPILRLIALGYSHSTVENMASALLSCTSTTKEMIHVDKMFTVEMPGVWVKPNGQTQRPEEKLASAYEHFMILKKGKPLLATQGVPNVFAFDSVNPNTKVHPTERPAPLINKLLTTFCRHGYNVLVPFAGSGRTMLEAAKLGMTSIGFDLSQLYKDSYIIAVNKELGK